MRTHETSDYTPEPHRRLNEQQPRPVAATITCTPGGHRGAHDREQEQEAQSTETAHMEGHEQTAGGRAAAGAA